MVVVEILVILRREEARDGQRRSRPCEFQRARAAIRQVLGITGIPHRAVARHHVQGAIRIGGHAATALPDAAGVPVGRVVVDDLLLQRGGVVSQDPAVIRPPIAVGRKTHVYDAVEERQTGALILFLGIECDHAVDAPVAIAADGGGDESRAAADFIPVEDVHGVQKLSVRAAVGTAGDEIHRPARAVDHRRADDSNAAAEIVVGATTCPGHIGGSRRPHT